MIAMCCRRHSPSTPQAASTCDEVSMDTADNTVLSPPLPVDLLAESSEDSMSEDNGEWKEVSDAEGDWEQSEV